MFHEILISSLMDSKYVRNGKDYFSLFSRSYHSNVDFFQPIQSFHSNEDFFRPLQSFHSNEDFFSTSSVIYSKVDSSQLSCRVTKFYIATCTKISITMQWYLMLHCSATFGSAVAFWAPVNYVQLWIVFCYFLIRATLQCTCDIFCR